MSDLEDLAEGAFDLMLDHLWISAALALACTVALFFLEAM